MTKALASQCILASIALVTLQAGAEAQINNRRIAIEGTIRQAGTGVPIPGHLTWFERGEPAMVGRTAESDGVGKFRVEVLAQDELSLRGAATGHISERIVIPIAGQDYVQIDFHLEKAVPMSGYIVDSQGQPVSGANVRIVYPGSAHATGVEAEAGNVSTDSFGRFHLPYVKSEGRFLLEVSKEGVLPGHSQELSARGEAITNIVVPIPFKPGLTISGKVVDEAGAPVDGAWVGIFHESDPSVIPDVARASLSQAVRGGYLKVQTGSDGLFSVSGLPAAPFRVVVAHRSGRYAPTRVAFPNTQQFVSQTLTLTLKLKR